MQMDLLIRLIVAFGLVAALAHLVSTGLAIARCRVRRASLRAPAEAPGVTLVRPLRDVDRFEAETLRSSFTLDYRPYEVLFCVASAHDPVVPLVEQLIARHPHVRARLLFGEERINDNPKLNNMAKGWREARYDWSVIADSNVLMPRDAIQRLLSTWRPGTGLICSPPVGCAAEGFWSELECAFLNTYQARWQYAADSVDFGFAQGKVMMWPRDVLENAGGVGALGREPAEDAASTKVVHEAGLQVRLVDPPFPQALGRRSLGAVWQRQVRWARLRRATFPAFYVPEVLTSSLAPAAAIALFAVNEGYPVAACVGAFFALWYGVEALLAASAGWHLTWRSPAAWMLRDLMLPVVWLQGWGTGKFMWRGNAMEVTSSRGIV